MPSCQVNKLLTINKPKNKQQKWQPMFVTLINSLVYILWLFVFASVFLLYWFFSAYYLLPWSLFTFTQMCCLLIVRVKSCLYVGMHRMCCVGRLVDGCFSLRVPLWGLLCVPCLFAPCECSVSRFEFPNVHSNSINRILASSFWVDAVKWTNAQIPARIWLPTNYSMQVALFMVGLMSCEWKNIILMKRENPEGSSAVWDAENLSLAMPTPGIYCMTHEDTWFLIVHCASKPQPKQNVLLLHVALLNYSAGWNIFRWKV